MSVSEATFPLHFRQRGRVTLRLLSFGFVDAIFQTRFMRNAQTFCARLPTDLKSAGKQLKWTTHTQKSTLPHKAKFQTCI